MKIIKPRGCRIAAPTVDDIDAGNTPSLIGFWKCNEGSGNIITDYSGYGHDLTLAIDTTPWDGGFNPQLQPFSLDEIWAHRPGWLSLILGTNALIPATGTPLDHFNKTVVLSCEAIAEDNINDGTHWIDCDLGTAWDYPEVDYAYTGFMIGTGPTGSFARASETKTTNDTGFAGIVTNPYNEEYSMAGGFVPSDRVVFSIDKSVLKTNAAAGIASVDAQGGLFGFGPSASREFMCIRNYQIWVFDVAPVDLDMTVEWMSHNGGKIPPWWVGR